MPEYPIRDSIINSLNAQEPWPDNVKLFQPYEVEQILLPDNASCLAVQAFLKMCNLPFEVEMRWNAEFMSPSGRVPFIKCGAFVVSELEPIAQFAANKGVSLCSRLGSEEKAEMRAYMSLITNVLVNAELYISWLDNETFNQVTRVRNSSVYPWPLGWLQTRAKRNQVAKRLKALHWHDKTIDQVLADVEQCCNSLSQRLGEKDYFFGTPTPLDALVYGHVRALLSARGPKAPLLIKPISNAMLRHVVRITTLIGMKFTPQEEYLLQQALSPRRRVPLTYSLDDRNSRTRRSKLSIRHPSRDVLNKDVFGFKPFASKQIIIMQSEEGSLTCRYNDRRPYAYLGDDDYDLAVEIVDDIFDKVEELIIEGHNEKDDPDRADFEVIAFPNRVASHNESLNKFDDALEPLEENENTDSSISIDVDGGMEAVIQIINDDIGLDSDGVINDKHLNQGRDCDDDVIVENDVSAEGDVIVDAIADADDVIKAVDDGAEGDPISLPEMTDSSNNENAKDEYLTALASSGDRASIKNLSTKSTTSLRSSRFSSESKSTLKMPSDDEISVETLLNYLRKRNAAYNHPPEVADID